MAETISWSKTSEQDKVRLILESLGYFIMPETCCVRGRFKMPERNNIPDGFDWPIAYWRDDVECWMIRDIATDSRVFDPLRDMNDTMMIVDNEQFGSVEMKRYWKDGGGLPYGCQIVDEGIPYHSFAYTMQEAVCMAALKTIGYQVEG